jgi:PPOX class probable F420-dependent enzyme
VTTRRDGTPQLSPVAMGVDTEGSIAIATYPERAKAKNAARNSQGSVCVLSDDFNGEWVQIDGRIELVEQPAAIEALVDYFRSISGEHPDWAEYRRAMVEQQKVLLRLSIDRWSPISRGGFPARLVTGD